MDILIAEDDRIFRRALAETLARAGHRVRAASDGAAALALFRARRPDAVLLDVMMPVMDGLTACAEIRRADPVVPVLFLTAKDAEADELAGRGLGADDYIPKTVSTTLLLARLDTAVRRARPAEPTGHFCFGSWTVNPRAAEMMRAPGCRVDLTAREIAILRHFAAFPGEVFSKEYLLTRFWGAEATCGEGAVSTALHTLRTKLGPDADCLETAWGRGVRYRLPDGERSPGEMDAHGTELGKSEIRRAMKARRKGLEAAEKAAADAVVCEQLRARRDIVEMIDPLDVAVPLAVYLASSDEVNLDPYIAYLLRTGVEVVAPRWNGETYELARLKGLDERSLRRGPMGIREPADADIVKPNEVYVWIIPGLAFTRAGKRLGYGGGWYDRLLASAPKNAVKIGVAYSFQVVDSLPAEAHDMPLTDIIVGGKV